METVVRRHIPLGVVVIAAGYLFGALVLLLGTLTGWVDAREAIARAHGLPALAGNTFVILIALLALVMGYGLISLSRWGYFLTFAYSLYLAITSLAQGALRFAGGGDAEAQVYFGTLLWSALVMVYLLLRRRRFLARE
jgi:hypothetical protein